VVKEVSDTVFMSHRWVLSITFFTILLATAGTVFAQSSAYITGMAYADIKRFGSSGGVIYYYPYGNDYSLDGTAAGGGLRIGTFLHPKWTLELSVDDEGSTKLSIPNPYGPVIAIFPPVRLPDLKASSQFLTVSTTIGFHPAPHGPVKLGYFAGFSLIRSKYRSDLDVILPLAATALATPGLPPIPIPDVLLARPTAVTQITNTSGAVLGLEAAIDLTKRFAIVPEVRAVTFSLRGDGVFLIRPGVGVRWSF
jgi:hypothetical protein